MKLNTKRFALIAALLLLADRSLTGCTAAREAVSVPAAYALATPSPTAGNSYTDSSDGGHAILADGETAFYSNITVTKTGEAAGDKADFYGENAAVFAANGAELHLRAISVTTDGTHANAVFSYGEGTIVNIADSTISTSADCSGGLMTTGGGTMNADNVVVHTAGRSSAAIRSDRGGGIVNVTGGTFDTAGVGSPAIYSTADITVSDAELSAAASQGVVVEGKNAVTLNNVSLTASNTQKNSGKSPWYQAVMLYQSMSGDAGEGTAAFTARGGSITNLKGDIFFVTNTSAVINLTSTRIVNDDPDGVFLRAAAAGWGRENANGGHVELYTAAQVLDGDLLVDGLSALNLHLWDGSVLTGAVNPADEGEVYVELTDGAKWVLTGDSHIKSLKCEAGSIDLNGFTLTVDGEVYAEGTASEGSPVEYVSQSGERPSRPDGMPEPLDGGHGKDEKPPKKK